jgi:hypothetical protein
MKYSKEEESFIIENYPKFGATYCSSVLINRDVEAVGAKARRMGLRHESNFKHPSLCKNFSIDIIENPTKEFAYLLGFLWADGYILKKIDKKGFNHNRIVCEIVSDDFDMIWNNFKDFSKWSVSKRKRRENWKETKTATINNKYLYEFLESLGFKSKLEGFDKVFKYLQKFNLIDYFICGLFDGDGHTDFKKLIELSSSISQNWKSIEEIFKINNISYGLYYYKHPTKNHSASIIKIQNIEGFNWFNKNFLKNDIGLKRKRLN